MKTKTISILILVTAIALIATACGTRQPSGGEKVIKSTKAGDMTVTLASATGELKNGENHLIISFTDAAGNPVDIKAASLNFHMAGMGAMAEMNDKATLTTTDTPGKFRAKAEIEMAATWEAVISYQGAASNGQVRMTVNAK